MHSLLQEWTQSSVIPIKLTVIPIVVEENLETHSLHKKTAKNKPAAVSVDAETRVLARTDKYYLLQIHKGKESWTAFAVLAARLQHRNSSQYNHSPAGRLRFPSLQRWCWYSHLSTDQLLKFPKHWHYMLEAVLLCLNHGKSQQENTIRCHFLHVPPFYLHWNCSKMIIPFFSDHM